MVLSFPKNILSNSVLSENIIGSSNWDSSYWDVVFRVRLTGIRPTGMIPLQVLQFHFQLKWITTIISLHKNINPCLALLCVFFSLMKVTIIVVINVYVIMMTKSTVYCICLVSKSVILLCLYS